MQASFVLKDHIEKFFTNPNNANKPFFVMLKGDLGKGKTWLTKEVLGLMGFDKDMVRSPTFEIYHIHNLPNFGKVCHMDLYRLRSASELNSIGMDDLLLDVRLFFVEWPEILIQSGFIGDGVVFNLDDDFFDLLNGPF